MGDLGDWIEERFLDGKEPLGDIQVGNCNPYANMTKKTEISKLRNSAHGCCLKKVLRVFLLQTTRTP
jgi:hypothetical protein